MPTDLLKRSISLLLKSQTNILSAAYIIMATSILSMLLGIVRQRLLVSIFGASNILGIFDYSFIIPDTIFQATIGAALTSAFIPVFSNYLTKQSKEEANKLASNVLLLGLFTFFCISLVLFFIAPFVLQIFNLGGRFSTEEMNLMANILRIIMAGQMIFIVAQFFTAVSQSYNHFFVPGFAAAMYNLGSIIGIFFLSDYIGIYAAPCGVVIGSLIFALVQVPLIRRVGFSFTPTLKNLFSDGIKKILTLTYPRSISLIIFQIGTISIGSIISLLDDPGRMNVIYNLAKTLSYAPVNLFGLAIAQAAFPVLSREKDNPESFKETFLSSFNQLLYLVLPVSALILVLRIPIVRLVYGADAFDWTATVLTGRTLAFLSLSIFAQAIILLIYRAFWSLHNTMVPLVVGTVSTIVIVTVAFYLIVIKDMGIESIGLALSLGNILQLTILLIILDRSLGGFQKWREFVSLSKFFIATLCTGFALYIPIKLLDQLVFDTTRTINLIILTGISGTLGLCLYLFLTWFLSVKEANTYLLMFKKLGNWREILKRSDEVIDSSRYT